VGYVESVNTAVVRTDPWTGRVGRSGIDKRPVPGGVRFDTTGVHGDAVCDTKHHGAWYQAAYAFDSEELAHWARVLGRELVPGNAGENLTLTGCACSDAVVGERWRVGTAVLRVTSPRTPCRVFAGFWGEQRLVKLFTEHGRTGAYLAVERPGVVTAGDPVEVLSRPEHGVTVAEVFAFYRRKQGGLADRVRMALADLPDEVGAEVERELRRQEERSHSTMV
jgi:MOSC domain-containing protein YiiM